MAGEIAAVGDDVSDWQVGDRVCALLPGGGYAEQVNAPAQMLMPIPDDWSYEQAAAVAGKWGVEVDKSTIHTHVQLAGARASEKRQERV